MANEIKISVIMPVYKVEQYVGKAIESILNQTLTDFEFLIVDDGTPDRSGEICDEYAKKDARIQVFHKENGGAPSARNMAMDLAKGKYMYFMDSDDWAEPTMLEDMYTLAEENESQLVVAGFFIDTYYSDTEYRTDHFVSDDAVYANAKAFRKNAYKLFDKNLLYTPWNKLFLTEHLRKYNLHFPNTFWDDFPFNLSVIENVERVSVTSRQYYHFMRARAESETAAYRPEMYQKREEEHGWLVALYKQWGVINAETKEMLARRYIERFIGCVENLTNPKCTLTYKEKYAEVKKMMSKKRVSKMVALARPKSKYMKVMLVPIKLNSVWLTLLEAQTITFVKTRNTKLFSMLKAGR